MLKSYLLGTASAFLIAVICIMLFAFVCVGLEDPRSLMGLFGVAAFLIGAVSGAFIGASFNKEERVLSALFPVLTYTVTILVASWCFRDDLSRPVWQTVLFGAVAVGASLAVGLSMARRSSGVKNTEKKLRKRMMKR